MALKTIVGKAMNGPECEGGISGHRRRKGVTLHQTCNKTSKRIADLLLFNEPSLTPPFYLVLKCQELGRLQHVDDQKQLSALVWPLGGL